jgi:hypothetical protein
MSSGPINLNRQQSATMIKYAADLAQAEGC